MRPVKTTTTAASGDRNNNISNNVLIVDFSVVGTNPLHPLGKELRSVIWNALDQAERDASITSVILFGGNGDANFTAGADITEFAQYEKAGRLKVDDGGGDVVPTLVDIVDRIELFSKPVVAAIRGICLGGGLEIALSCHYRICDESAKLGLPEVSQSFVFGVGGEARRGSSGSEIVAHNSRSRWFLFRLLPNMYLLGRFRLASYRVQEVLSVFPGWWACQKH